MLPSSLKMSLSPLVPNPFHPYLLNLLSFLRSNENPYYLTCILSSPHKEWFPFFKIPHYFAISSLSVFIMSSGYFLISALFLLPHFKLLIIRIFFFWFLLGPQYSTYCILNTVLCTLHIIPFYSSQTIQF